METNYTLKRLKLFGTLVAVLFTAFLFSSYAAQAQTPNQKTLTVEVECYGTVKVKQPGNLDVEAYIEGPVFTETVIFLHQNQAYYFALAPDDCYEFVEWYDAPGYYVPQELSPLPGGNDAGYTHKITMTDNKKVRAIFELVDKDELVADMTDDFEVFTIPGTGPFGTPVVMGIDVEYGTVTGYCEGIKVDGLIQIDRVGDFDGLRLLSLQPNPTSSAHAPIDLDALADGRDHIYLTEIFSAITYPLETLPLELDDVLPGGVDNWEFTFDGLTKEEVFDITFFVIAYQDREDDLEDNKCPAYLASTKVEVNVNDIVAQTLNSPVDPIQLIECGEAFEFVTTMEYPKILNVDLNGEVVVDAILHLDTDLPAGAEITLTYSDDTGGSWGPYTYVTPDVLEAGEDYLLSEIVVALGGAAPTPLAGHDELEVTWEISVANIPSGIFDLHMIPVVYIDADVLIYPYGQELNVEMVNTLVEASLDIENCDISTAINSPVILAVETVFGNYDHADHQGILLDGKISGYPVDPEVTVTILGVRAGGADLVLFDPDGVVLTGAYTMFSDIFDFGLPIEVEDISGATIEWEFDLLVEEDDKDPIADFDLKFELFTQFQDWDGVWSDECVVAEDEINLDYNQATLSLTGPETGCLNSFIPFNFEITYPVIECIEPVLTGERIFTDLLFTVQRDLPAFTVIEVDGVEFELTEALEAGETFSLASAINSPYFVEVSGDTYNFDIALYIPNTDNYDAYSLFGDYTITVWPVVDLDPYNLFFFVDPVSHTVNIPLFELTMATDPAPPVGDPGTTYPEVPGPYEFACGAWIDIDAEPNPLGGWFFKEWSNENCEQPETGYGEFYTYVEIPENRFRMPKCDDTVTAHFTQEEYTLSIGVIGCDQKVNVIVDGYSSPFQLSGNRACAPIETTDATYLTFTHGETIYLEIMPVGDEYVWGSWLYCDKTGDPLGDDPDFTYMGLNDNDRHQYKLIFRGNKNLYAHYQYKLDAAIAIEDRVYDATTVAVIDANASTLSATTDCPTYGHDVELDFSGAVASFEDKHVGDDKEVSITGVALAGDDAHNYILNPAGFDPLTGYAVGNTDFMSEATITPFVLTVTASAEDKVYDGNRNAQVSVNVSGFFLGDVVSVNTPTTGLFATQHAYVAQPQNVTYAAPVLSGPDAHNYILPVLPIPQATIEHRPIRRINLVAETKEYDATTDAVITGWGVWETGIIGEGPVGTEGPHILLQTAGYVAHFDTPFIGTQTVTVTGLGLTGPATGPNVNVYRNYVLTAPEAFGMGTIVEPAYAMFHPAYETVDPDVVPPVTFAQCNTPEMITDVKVEEPLHINFSRSIFDNQGNNLPTDAGIGNFVRLEKWVGTGTPDYDSDTAPDANWEHVDFFAERNGTDIEVTPGIQGINQPVNLEWGTYYRLRYNDIWAYNSQTNELQRVKYRLDKIDGEYDVTEPCALHESRQVIFRTIDQLISPVVEPLGCPEDGHPYDAEIKVTFVNPVKYTNFTLVADQAGHPTHKFQLQARRIGTHVYEDVKFTANPSDFVQAPDGNFGPTVITLIPQHTSNHPLFMDHPAGEMLHHHEYRVIWRDGMEDDGAGFLDMTDGGHVGARWDGVAPDNAILWEWCTTSDFEIRLTYQQNSQLVFPLPPAAPVVNNVYLWTDGTEVGNVDDDGNIFGVTTDNVYTIQAQIGEGYHIHRWTLNGSQIGIPAFTGTTRTWTAEAPVPYFQYMTWDVEFRLNRYTVSVKPSSAIRGEVRHMLPSPMPWFSGTTTNFQSRIYDHGDFVELEAQEKPGYYATTWSRLTHPGDLLYNIQVTDWTYNAVDPHTKPDFLTPRKGEASFRFLGDHMPHNRTYQFQANFDVFTPRVDGVVVTDTDYDPADYNNTKVGRVLMTTEFTGGIITSGDGWMVFDYETDIILTAVSDQCGWEFKHWLRWKGNYDIHGSRIYEVFNAPNPITMSIVENYDLKAVFTRKIYDVFVDIHPASPADATVRIVGTDIDGNTVDHYNPDVAYQFFYNEDMLYDPIYFTVFPDWGYEVFDHSDHNLVLVDQNNARSIYRYYVECADDNIHNIWFNLRKIRHSIVAKPSYETNPTGQDWTRGKVEGTPASAVTQLNFFRNFGEGALVPVTNRNSAQGTFEHFEENLTLTATPKQYYKFLHWYDVTYGQIVGEVENPVYEIDMVTEPRDIRAVFGPDLPRYHVTIDHIWENEGGKGYTVPGVNPAGYYIYHPLLNTGSVQFQAVANDGYVFVDWDFVNEDDFTLAELNSMFFGSFANNFDPDDPNIAFRMPEGDVQLQANYRKKDYTLIVTSLTYIYEGAWYDNIIKNQVNLVPNPEVTFNYGDLVDLEAIADAGFVFVNWMEGDYNDHTQKMTGYQIEGSTSLEFEIPQQGDKVIEVFALFREVGTPRYPLHNVYTHVYPAGKAIKAENDGAGHYPETVDVEITQGEPIPGWEFDRWVITDGVNLPVTYFADPTISMVGGSPLNDEGLTYHATAHYKLKYYTITAVAAHNLGTVALDDGTPSNVVQKQFTIDSPDIKVVAEPVPNYQFTHWTYDLAGLFPVNLPGIGQPGPTFYHIPKAESVTFYAQFERVSFAIETQVVTQGSWSDMLVGGTAEITEGVPPFLFEDIIKLEATAFPGYEFLYWTDGNDDFIIENGEFFHEVLGNKVFKAWFQAIPYDVTPIAGENGSVAVSSDETSVPADYTVEQPVTITAVPDAGYEYDADALVLTGIDLADVTVTITGEAGTDQVVTMDFLMPVNDVEVFVGFKAVPYDVTATAGTGGGVLVTPAAGPYYIGDPVEVLAIADEGYQFTGWTGISGVTIDAGVNPAQFIMSNEDVTLHANFELIDYTLTLVVAPEGGAGVLTGGGIYNFGDEVDITATANDAQGWSFVEWVDANGDTVSDDPDFVFDMPASDVILTAVFVQDLVSFEGKVRYFNETGTQMPGGHFAVWLGDEHGNMISDWTLLTTFENSYMFDDLAVGTYTIRVKDYSGYTEGLWETLGITGTDARIVQNMANNQPMPNRPWLYSNSDNGMYTDFGVRLADVDGDGELEVLDALFVALRVGGSIDTFGVEDFQVSGVFGPTVSPRDQAPEILFEMVNDEYFEAHIELTFEDDTQVFDIFFIATADMRARAIPQQTGKTASMDMLYDGVQTVSVGEQVALPISLTGDAQLGALTLDLEFNSDLIDVYDVTGEGVIYHVDNNRLTAVSIADQNVARGETIAVIHATVKGKISAEDQLFYGLTSRSEIATPAADVIEGLDFVTTALLTDGTVNVDDVAGSSFSISNFPNPFQNATTIRYTIPETAEVVLQVFNQQGQLVRTLVNETQTANVYEVVFERESLNAGVYFYRIAVNGESASHTSTNSMVIMR